MQDCFGSEKGASLRTTRKNYLFVAHPDAGQRTAIIYCMVVSRQRRKIAPLAYLRAVLRHLPAIPFNA